MPNKPALSKRAEALLSRVKKGDFYRPFSSDLPSAMKELEEAGLVTMTGRVTRIELCYVPATGYEPFREEKFNG